MIRPWRRTRPGRRDGYQQLVARSLTALELRHRAQASLLRLHDASSVVDQDKGLITFTRPCGQVATAPVQIVGTLDPAAGTWLWGWDHPSVEPSLGVHARRVREWGELHDVEELTTRVVSAADDDAWRFAAVACELNGAQGAWRCDTEGPAVLVTLGTVTLSASQTSRGSRTPAAGSARDGDWVCSLEGADRVDEPEVLGLVRAWMTGMHGVESRYRNECGSRSPDPDRADQEAARRAIDDMQPVYERFWRREDEYHRPCAVGMIRWYDVEAMRDWTVYRLTEDVWRVAYREPLTGSLLVDRAYDVRRFCDGLRIVDHLD